jgi:hypothetical protein
MSYRPPAVIAIACHPKAGGNDPFYAVKLVTGRYFLARVLPDAGACLAKVKTGAGPVMALPAEAF